jgi:hypothetical protein
MKRKRPVPGNDVDARASNTLALGHSAPDPTGTRSLLFLGVIVILGGQDPVPIALRIIVLV